MIEFYALGSTLSRDGLHMHATRPEDTDAACGASGVSFSIFDKFRYEKGEFFLLSDGTETWSKCHQNPISCKKCYSLLLDQHLATRRPVKVEADEWYYWGCVIMRNSDSDHNCRPKYHTIQDIEGVGKEYFCGYMKEAKKWCRENKVTNPMNGLQEHLS